jgi:DNA-binding response OmpR family regulator
MKVLVIEHNESLRVMWNMYFSSVHSGFCVSIVSLEEVLRLLIDLTPTITFINIGLDLEAVDKYKSIQNQFNLRPTVLVTARPDGEKLLIKYEFDHLLKMPFNIDELDKIVVEYTQ